MKRPVCLYSTTEGNFKEITGESTPFRLHLKIDFQKLAHKKRVPYWTPFFYDNMLIYYII